MRLTSIGPVAAAWAGLLLTGSATASSADTANSQVAVTVRVRGVFGQTAARSQSRYTPAEHLATIHYTRPDLAAAGSWTSQPICQTVSRGRDEVSAAALAESSSVSTMSGQKIEAVVVDYKTPAELVADKLVNHLELEVSQTGGGLPDQTVGWERSPVVVPATVGPDAKIRLLVHLDGSGNVWRVDARSGSIGAEAEKARAATAGLTEKKKNRLLEKVKKEEKVARLRRERLRAKLVAKGLSADEVAAKEAEMLVKSNERNLRAKGEPNRPAEIEQTDQAVARLRLRSCGPLPILSDPIRLRTDGTVDGPAVADQKSFLQRYWWVVLVLVLVQFVIPSPAEEEKK